MQWLLGLKSEERMAPLNVIGDPVHQVAAGFNLDDRKDEGSFLCCFDGESAQVNLVGGRRQSPS